MTMEPGNPLLKYYDFGGDMRVDSIRHNGGCFAYFGEGSIIPEGTEVLMRYDYDTIPDIVVTNGSEDWPLTPRFKKLQA